MQNIDTKPIILTTGEGEQVSMMGTTFTFKTTSTETGGTQFVFESVSPPGVMAPPHVHANEDEFCYVLQGEVDVQLGDEVMRLKVGDVAFLPRNTPHALFNPGPGTNKTLFVVTPGGSEGFFREGAALTSGGPPDMQKFAQLAADYGITFLGPPPAGQS